MSVSVSSNGADGKCPGGFVPIAVRTLRATRADAVDLFVQYEAGNQPRLYSRADLGPSDDQYAELLSGGIENLYVRSRDFPAISNQLLDSVDSILKEPLIHSAEKYAALQLAVAIAVEQTLRLVDCSKFHTLAEKVGQDLVNLFTKNEPLPRELFRLARHDFTTFSHVTNVASYCVMLARQTGLTDTNELRKIATAAMLHDLGKRFIPDRILTKAGPLTRDERDVVESHPLRGYSELCDSSNLDFGQLMMVYQHHEHVDGSGYPVRIRQDEIHPWARMLSIVDVFDTMTARRGGEDPATPESVFEYQRQQAGTRFDGEYVECWISTMTKA